MAGETAGATRAMTPLNAMYSYYERLLARHGMNANSCEWIEIDGPVDASALRRAAVMVQRRHPVLRAAVRGDRWTMLSADIAPPPELIESRRDDLLDGDVVNALMDNIWRRPLPLATGPALRLHLTRLGDRAVLQLVTSHLFTDGRSANVVVADLLDAYDCVASGRAFDEAAVDMPDRDLRALYLGDIAPLRRRALYRDAAAAIARDAARPCQKIATPGRRRGMTRVILRSLGDDMLASLRAASAGAGMSRHPFYVLAAARAITGYNQRRGARADQPLRFIDNVSMRRFGKPPIDQLYELCAIPYMLPVDAGLDDLALMRQAAAGVAALHGGKALEEVARQQLLAASAALSPKVLGLRLVLSTIVKSNFILSNIGHVPDAMWNHPSLAIRDYYSFSQLFPPGDFMIFLSTARQDLRLVCLYDSANFTDDDAEELIGDFQRHLAAAAATHARREEQRPGKA